MSADLITSAYYLCGAAVENTVKCQKVLGGAVLLWLRTEAHWFYSEG